MLDTRLITFLTLCNTKSFTKTAEKLHITQPAVSHHIKYLEDYYQTKLYTYKNRNFLLTKAGEVLYDYTNSFYSDSERIRDQLPLLASQSHKLRLGAERSAGESFLGPLILDFMKAHPNYKIKVITNDYEDLSKKLNAGEIDFFLMDGTMPKAEHDYFELCQNSIVCVCSPEHPLAEKTVPVSELYNNTLILGAEKTLARARIDDVFRQNHMSSLYFSNMIEVSNSITIIKHLLLENIGISFVYKNVVAKELKNGTLRQIYVENYHESHSYNLVFLRKSHFHIAEPALIQFCQEFLKQWDT